MKRVTIWLAGLVLAASVTVSACGSTAASEHTWRENTQTENTQIQTEASTKQNERNMVSMSASAQFDFSAVPEYSGQAYVPVNGNVPFFNEEELTTESFETYGELDSLGRCTAASASVGQDLMPTAERGSIGQVKPTGWHTVKYDNVDGKYLYNRCHLIGYQLTAENANEENLITGTRYFNTEGMLLFENMVADYVKETGNHVMYRVTPVFEGDNLVASGVLMEGKSVEDGGEGVLFCVYVYNVQPGIAIDYKTGNSRPAGETEQETASQNESYILNIDSKKFHKPGCSSVGQMKDSNKQEFTGTREELISQGYAPCKRCNP